MSGLQIDGVPIAQVKGTFTNQFDVAPADAESFRYGDELELTVTVRVSPPTIKELKSGLVRVNNLKVLAVTVPRNGEAPTRPVLEDVRLNESIQRTVELTHNVPDVELLPADSPYRLPDSMGFPTLPDDGVQPGQPISDQENWSKVKDALEQFDEPIPVAEGMDDESVRDVGSVVDHVRSAAEDDPMLASFFGEDRKS